MPGKNFRVWVRGGTSDPFVFEQVYLRNQYDIDKKIRRCHHILDAGAYVGYSSIYFAERYPNAKVYAIEPESENFKLLKKNCQGFSNIIPIEAALWNHSKQVVIESELVDAWSFQTCESHGDNSKKINAITIDKLISDNKIPSLDLIKIDIEGAEKEVFSIDCTKWLNQVAHLIIEPHNHLVNDCMDNFFSTIDQQNFVMEWKGENLFFTRLETSPSDSESVA